MIKLLKKIKEILDPGYWAEKIGNKSGAYDRAKRSSLREWALGLTGWKWWSWQIGVGGVFFILIEIILNSIGLTMLPW